MIRILALAMCLIVGASAFAQDKQEAVPENDQPQTEEPVETQEKLTRNDMVANGFVLGLSYENLESRTNAPFTEDGVTYDFKDDFNGDNSIGFPGIRLGYGFMPLNGLGYIGAFTIERSSKKDISDRDVMLYKGEMNLSIGTSIMGKVGLYSFAGFHVAYLSPSNYVSPLGFGVQLCVGLSVSAHWAFEAGTAATIHFLKDDFYNQHPGSDKNGSYANAGWIFHLNYNF